MLKKKQNKKGFTLAELLIVVAIIAVLTAIAVPLFVGALDDAESSVDAANKRAVRVAAVDKILLDDELMYYPAADGTKTQYADWTVEALIGADGNITQMKITKNKTAKNEAEVCHKLTADDVKEGEEVETYKVNDTAGEKGGYYVKICVTDTNNEATITEVA